jgi:DNA-binding transcriptional LysR family regulator
MVKPEHLQTLREVINRGSFAAAANRLGYTASAVSQQMAALERETGVRLFHRSARSVLPTDAAEVMARHAQIVLADIDRLVAAVGQTHRSTAFEIRLGVFPSFGTHVLPDALRQLDPDGRANIRVIIDEPSGLIRRLGPGREMDAAIVYQVGQSGLSWPSSVHRRWIAEDWFKVVFPRTWRILPAPPYPAEQLADLPWIMHHPGSSDATTVDAMFALLNLHPHVVCHSDDFNVTLALVASGLGAALVPDLALRGHRDDIVIADIPWFNISRSIFALIQPDRGSTELRMLLDALTTPMAPPERHEAGNN